MPAKKAQLYLRGYPTLIDQINRLVSLAQTRDPNIGALILYGSTARLAPRYASDADVLVLCERPREFSPHSPENRQDRGIYLIVEATSAEDEWPFAVLDTDLQGSDLSPLLLANVTRDGVLLYQREGVSLPPALEKLQPYETWLKRVQALLDRYKRAASPASA